MENTKITVFGGSGGLGVPVVHLLKMKYGHEKVAGLSSSDVDIKSEGQVAEYLQEHTPNVVINMAVRNIDGLIHKQMMPDVQEQINTTVIGNYHIMKHAVPEMRKLGGGRLIYVSSILAKNPIMGTGVYASTKAFNENLMRTIALENAKYGITSNTLRLGYCEKGLIEKVPEKVLEGVKNTIPLKRFGTVEEVFNSLVFLIENAYVTGTTITMAGGL